MKTAFSLMLFATLSGCATGVGSSAAYSSNPVPVEIVTGGDDGLTQRLVDAVRGEFGKSSAFTFAPASATNALIVTIPTHVGWNDVGKKTRVTYQLRLERAGRVLEESAGACWEDQLRVCAETIVNAAGRGMKL